MDHMMQNYREINELENSEGNGHDLIEVQCNQSLMMWGCFDFH
jgi:hypothetical protein